VTRLLLRAKKDPFEVASPEATLDRNLIGTNSGNLIFIDAAYKLLATGDTQIDVDRFRADPADAARINETYDAYIVPLANAFRPSFESQLIALTGLIERLRIPVVILGVGAQSSQDYDLAVLKPMDRSTRAFVKAVLERAPSLGVRGEFSQAYLKSLGFSDVEVIGCPSMFLHGPALRIDKKVPQLEADSRVALNAGHEDGVLGEILLANHARYPELAFIWQDLDILAMLLWGEVPRGATAGDKLPRHPAHPLVRANKVKMFVDPWPWFDYLGGFDFAFGSRIHGNIAALVAGTPAYVATLDSRTLELAQYFDIPHRPLDEMDPNIDLAQLYEAADYSALNDGHGRRFRTFTDFLARHNLDHVYADGEDPASFDARVAATPYPPAVDSQTASRAQRPVSPTRRLRYRLRGVTRWAWVSRLRAARQRSRLSRRR
jgi:hypothetical protein